MAHLRPGQMWQRLRLTARRALWQRRSAGVDARYRARGARLEQPNWSHSGLAAVAAFRARLRPEADALAIARDALEGRFSFLGRSEELGRDVDWYRADLDVGTRLWKTQLHEFSFAEDLARATVAAGDDAYRARLFELVASWRAASPIGRRDYARDAWNARAVATRLMHWAVAGSLLRLDPSDAHADALGRELAVHGLFLRDNLELDLLGNHLLRDAVGLVFAQELVGGIPDALAWLERQVAEQVLPDGGHIERAPMYHAICLQDLLEARLLLGDRSPAWLDDSVRRMASFLESILLGDGELPLLGDGWLGEVSPAPLIDGVRELLGPLPAVAAPEQHSGLVPLHAGAWRAVVRAGALGPDYLLGHAHADLLSLDLSLGARRVVTDTGTSLYDAGPERQQLRSVIAHNTLRIDSEEPIEAWGSFRVGRRGRAQVNARGSSGVWQWLAVSHDGYRWLPGQPTHHRLVAICEGCALILDVVTGTGRHRIESHLNEHPERPREVQLRALGHRARQRTTPLHEHFGESREMTQHAVAFEGELPWCGGWLVDPGETTLVDALLRFNAGVVTLRTRGDLELDVRWRPGADPEPVTFALCPTARGSAN